MDLTFLSSALISLATCFTVSLKSFFGVGPAFGLGVDFAFEVVDDFVAFLLTLFFGVSASSDSGVLDPSA